MKHTGFHYRVEVDLVFTREEVDHLIGLSQRHYDSTCKNASRQGGFLYGMKNRIDDEVDVEYTLDSHQIDILQKICEGERSGDKISLYEPVRDAHLACIREWIRLNEGEKS